MTRRQEVFLDHSGREDREVHGEGGCFQICEILTIL